MIKESIDSIETYVYGTSKDLVSEKEDIKYCNIIKQYKKDWIWCCYKIKLARNSWPSIQNNNSRLWIWKKQICYFI